jgi:superfamily II DNA or RNA helicase
MGDLSRVVLKTSYHKGRDNVASAFYMPCMERAILYRRAVGFFRSTIFVIAWSALRSFVSQGGRYRLLCSQVMADDDVAALEQGYAARVDSSLADRFAEEVRELLNDAVLQRPARILAALVAQGFLEVRVAVLREQDMRGPKGRIFHDKLGIFEDQIGNVVVFKGSMNETWTGLSSDGNIESVDVYASWMGTRDLERVETEVQYFEDLWSNRYPSLWVRPFPEVAKSELKRLAEVNWADDLDEMLAGEVLPPTGRTLRPHQSAGLASWAANGRRGILAFATGSGKTFTALTAIREALERGEVVIVIVPDQTLFGQWSDEIVGTLSDMSARILRCGAGHSNWRDALPLWTTPEGPRRIALATVQTAATSDFLTRVSAGTHLLLVADEVHRLGSPVHSKLLDERVFAGPRLGLSATPERAGDPTGTSRLLTFFGGILEPRYTLADAVRDKVLCSYFYRPHAVQLTADEGAEWAGVTAEIAQLRARLASGDSTPGLGDRIDRLLIRRARIVKHAERQLALTVEVLSREYEQGQRWIVYCDDMTQLERVAAALAAAGISTMPYHSQMQGSRTETLRWLARRGGVVVAIRCLDEGVDIPQVTHALILASSKNPREFIQRRGRLLRTAPGKALAYVHDAIVVPSGPLPEAAPIYADPILVGEIARALEFAQHADNPAAAADLQQLAIDWKIDWRDFTNVGVEDADE